MSDDDLPLETKLTRTKQQWARDGRFLTGQSARPQDQRLPPGQHLVQTWPVLDLGFQPDVPRERWRLDITGAVEQPASWSFDELMALPQSRFVTDIHCVTTWSRYDNRWDGVSTRDVMAMVRPRAEARAVMLHSNDGYATNLPIEDFAAENALFVHRWNETPLSPEHGGPVRLVVPHLYFWKSAKWIKAVEFLTSDKPGYWEDNGYHMRGDPWAEQRYSGDS